MSEPGWPERRPSGRSACLVLVVEDEVFIALEIEAVLLDDGFRVLGPVPSVGEALDLLALQTPDAAVLDVNLRGEMVSAVAEALRRMHVPFVVTTAYEYPEQVAGVLAGVPHLGKPTDGRALVEALRGLLG